MYRILLVEDDRALAEAVRRHLESYGNEVTCVADFADVIGEFAACRPQLVLMDIKLPYRDGYYWCSRIREISAVPVVFLSSASDNMNIVMALNMGGDDFIAKPVDPMVLTAKVQAVLRRTYEIAGAGHTVEFCGATLCLGDNCVRTEQGQIELTKNEFRILQTLLENRGKIVSREELMMRLWQSDLYVEENTLTVNVARLRKKLGAQVFGNPEALARLSAITQPRVVESIRTQLGPGLSVIDAIGLLESGLGAICDITVAVTAPAEARIARLTAREGITRDYAAARIAAQKSNVEFSAACDYTLENDGTQAEFRRKCRTLF